MDALGNAISIISMADGYNVDMAMYEATKAIAYAAIAQAEQLKRIADILEYQMVDTPRPHDGIWAVVDGLNQRID